MEETFRFKNKPVLYLLSVFSLAAAVISILSLEQTISEDISNWYNLIVRAILSVIFICQILYAIKIDKGSKSFFHTLLVSYGLLIAFTGFIFPYEYGSPVADKAVQAVLLSMYGGLFIFYYNWRFIRKSTFIVAVITMADIALSVWYLCINPQIAASQYAFINVCQVLLRPAAILFTAAAYYFRMKEKLSE